MNVDVVIRRIDSDDWNAYHSAFSSPLVGEWVKPFGDYSDFIKYYNSCDGANKYGFVVESPSKPGEILGIININNVVMGAFRSGALGYYTNPNYLRQGIMRAGISEVINIAKSSLKLHRLEANIQPANTSSIRLIESLGFSFEGLSKSFLYVSGSWRDHYRYAMTFDE